MLSNFSKLLVKTFLVFFHLTLLTVCFSVNALEDSEFIVTRVEGSVEKVCQLIGDFDKERSQSTMGLTYTRYGVGGTDLGVSFEYNNTLVFLFGDTVGRSAFPFSGKDDSFAYTHDETPDDGLNLTFFADGLCRFLPPMIQGISQGPFEVPMEGIDVDGTAYVYFTTNHTEEKTMGSSVLAKLHDGSLNFTFVYMLSTEKFINVQVVSVNNSQVSGLPESSGRGLLIWGSGNYRASDPYLAYMPFDSIENKSSIRYFAGLDGAENPLWSGNESEAQPLFHDPVIGELSIAWNQHLQRWIMLYGGVTIRSSKSPWGTWSPKQVLFDAFRDHGYGYFIHWPGKDNISDPFRQDQWGGPYGPYIIDKFTTGNNETSTIYFALSTWNPYTTVLMKADLQLKPLSEIPEWPEQFLTIVMGAVTTALFLFYRKRHNY